jgi:predicted nucleic acid-binding protein
VSKVFVDTSAIYALLSRTDRGHQRIRTTFERLKAEEAEIITPSYVLVESYALRHPFRSAVRTGPFGG